MNRYVLIDYMHLAHRCMQAQPLSTTVEIDGMIQTVDTTVPTYTIKNIFNYAGRGVHFAGVCFEGGSSNRKKYFTEGTGDDAGYKGTRQRQNGSFYRGINLAIQLMINGKVSLYRKEGLEADDMLYSLVQKIKSVDTTTPIDIITNDSDLLPLVDEQVSVYMRGTRTHAEEGCPERNLYYQVTPETWDDYLSYTSAYKNFVIPYNSMLLFKLIRGDKADNISASVKGFGGVKYSQLMEQMLADNIDFPNVFRYGKDFDTVMRPVLMKYFEDDVIEKMKFIYNGINLVHQDVNVPKQIELGLLQSALNPVRINLVR